MVVTPDPDSEPMREKYFVFQVYDESTDSWMIHKQLPTTSDKNIFINRADSGCIRYISKASYTRIHVYLDHVKQNEGSLDENTYLKG